LSRKDQAGSLRFARDDEKGGFGIKCPMTGWIE